MRNWLEQCSTDNICAGGQSQHRGLLNYSNKYLVTLAHSSKDLIVVLLDSWGKHSRVGDANRIKKWVETTAAAGIQG